MTNRSLLCIVKDQTPLAKRAEATVREACAAMTASHAGSVLVVDGQRRLVGIFTGRDAVRLLASTGDAGSRLLGEAMTPRPVTVEPHCRAIDALAAMDRGGFRHVPVTSDGRIIGTVSRSDFKGMELEVFKYCACGTLTGSPAERRLGDIVADRASVTVKPAATVQEACRAMWQSRTGSAVVVDGHGKLKGIFTGRDAVRLLAKPGDPSISRVKSSMSPDPVTLPPEAHSIDALRTMNDRGFRHIPVVDGEKLLGVVSRGDFTGFELDRLEEEDHLKECIW